MFPGSPSLPEIPDTLYDVFQKTYGVLVTHTEERLTATVDECRLAPKTSASPPVRRCSGSSAPPSRSDGRPVEWRVSLCHLKGAYYLARTR